MEHQLDLRGVACPLNFVRTKLFLDKLQPGEVVSVLLDAGEPVESVSSSVAADGHLVETPRPLPGGYFCVSIRKG